MAALMNAPRNDDPLTGKMMAALLHRLANADNADELLDAATRASARTLNEGIYRETTGALRPELLAKHRARLRSAFLAVALLLDENTSGNDVSIVDAPLRSPALIDDEGQTLPSAARARRQRVVAMTNHHLLATARAMMTEKEWSAIETRARELHPSHPWPARNRQDVSPEVADAICSRFKPFETGVRTLAYEFHLSKRIVKEILIERRLWTVGSNC